MSSSFRRALASACLAFAAVASASAAIVSATQQTSIPTSLVDPLGSLPSLASNQFLVELAIDDAINVQQWSLTLFFNPLVATPTDVGGLTQFVYGAMFSATDVSDVLSSGVLISGQLQDIAGAIAFPVSGDGPLAYVLFQYQDGQVGVDPSLRVVDALSPNEAPLPSTSSLVFAAALALGVVNWRRRAAGASDRARRLQA